MSLEGKYIATPIKDSGRAVLVFQVKMGLLRWPLVVSQILLLLCLVRLGAGLELTEELDSLLCPSIEEKKGKIIDVHKSLELGAELIDGSWEPSLERCMSECCHKPGCDLALYKNEGVSQSGKNCYFIKCVSENNCVMVDHNGFTSVLFRLSKEDGNTGVCVCVRACACVCAHKTLRKGLAQYRPLNITLLTRPYQLDYLFLRFGGIST